MSFHLIIYGIHQCQSPSLEKNLNQSMGVRSHIFLFFVGGGVFIFYIAFTVVYMYAIVDACRKKKTCQAKDIERKKKTKQ